MRPLTHRRTGPSCSAIPTQLITLPTDFTFAQGRYHLANEAVQDRAVHLAEELIMYTTIMHPLRTRTADASFLPRTNGFHSLEQLSTRG